MGKPRDEGLGVPMAEGRVVDEALANGSPSRGLDEVGLQTRLINRAFSDQVDTG